MDEAFEARLDLNKCAEIGKAGYRADDALAGDEALGSLVPRLRLQLLEAERDLFGLWVDLENAEL